RLCQPGAVRNPQPCPPSRVSTEAGVAQPVPFSSLKLMLVESLDFAVVLVGAVLSRKSVGGVASAPVPCRKKSDVLCAWARPGRLTSTARRQASRRLNAPSECASVNRRGVRGDDQTTAATCTRGGHCEPMSPSPAVRERVLYS